MLNLSLKELKLTAKNKGYKRMSDNRLLSILNVPEPIKKINLSET